MFFNRTKIIPHVKNYAKGDPEDAEISNKLCKQLNFVHFGIRPDLTSNLNFVYLETPIKIQNDLKNHLKKMGIDTKFSPRHPMGGGPGLLDIISAFKEVWGQRELIGFGIKFITTLISTYKTYFKLKNKRKGPILFLELSLKTDCDANDIEKTSYEGQLRNRIIQLLNISDESKRYIEEGYPLFKIHRIFSIILDGGLTQIQIIDKSEFTKNLNAQKILNCFELKNFKKHNQEFIAYKLKLIMTKRVFQKKQIKTEEGDIVFEN